MKFTATHLPDVVLIEPAVFADDRGWFMESFSQKRFTDGLAALGLPQPRPFVQDNESHSAAGVLRGLHYQLPPQLLLSILYTATKFSRVTNFFK